MFKFLVIVRAILERSTQKSMQLLVKNNNFRNISGWELTVDVYVKLLLIPTTVIFIP